MKDDGFVAVVMVACAFLSLLVMSSCTKDQTRTINAKEAYVACVNAQKSSVVDMKCGQGK